MADTMYRLTFDLALLIISYLLMSFSVEEKPATLRISSSSDFEITGDGRAANWAGIEWVTLPQRKSPGVALSTQVKVLYSETGIYFLFQCEDRRLTATMTEDFLDLWNEDVVEVFLWTDENFPAYFEYELSPLNYELPILIPNHKGSYWGWRPWHYEGERRIRHATSAQGGEKKSGASITSWTAEFFIPYALLKPLGQVPPNSGTKWRVNMYRCDYDDGKPATWSWQPTEINFHEYQKFGTFQFE